MKKIGVDPGNHYDEKKICQAKINHTDLNRGRARNAGHNISKAKKFFACKEVRECG